MPDIQALPAMTVRLEAARHAIAAEVRAEMARQNKTLRDIAEILGMHHTSWHLRMKGEVPFRGEELVLLASTLGVPVEQFLRSAQAGVA